MLLVELILSWDSFFGYAPCALGSRMWLLRKRGSKPGRSSGFRAGVWALLTAQADFRHGVWDLSAAGILGCSQLRLEPCESKQRPHRKPPAH